MFTAQWHAELMSHVRPVSAMCSNAPILISAGAPAARSVGFLNFAANDSSSS
jgi:hypothetical protein